MQNNSIVKARISKKTKIKIIIAVVLILTIIGYIFWDIVTNGPLTSFLSNKDAIVKWIDEHGMLAPLAYIFLEIFQAILAPIPGQVVGGVGGFLFGWWGILWTMIGTGIGAFVVFFISRRFGRPLIEKIIKKDDLDKFDFIVSKDASFILFIIFLLPVMPDDIICYIAGLTEIPIKKLLVLFLLGRIPSVIVVNYIGAGLGEENLAPLIAISLFVVIVLAIIFWQRERIINYLKNKS